MNSEPRISYISQLFILIGLTGFGALLGSLGSLVVWKVLAGGGALNMETDMLKPENATAVKIVQLVASFAMFLLPAVMYAAFVSRKPAKFLGLKTRFSFSQLGLVVIIVFAGFYLTGALSEVTHHIPKSAEAEKLFRKWEKTYTDQVMAMANMNHFGDYLFTLLVIALAPAIFEEVLFRGGLQQVLMQGTKPWMAIAITSIIFSAVHLSHYGFIARFGLGMILGYMFYYSKSLWLPIIAHFINNAFAVTMMYYLKQQGKLSTKALDERFPIWWGVIALAIIIALLIIYRNESKRSGNFYADNTEINDDDPFATAAPSLERKWPLPPGQKE